MSCHAAKEFLSHHKIPFTDRNVVEDATAMTELVEKIGRRATPVIIVNGEVIVGFDRGKLERILGL
jgi:glutaredoxin